MEESEEETHTRVRDRGRRVHQPGTGNGGSSGCTVGRVLRILLGTPVAPVFHGCHSGVWLFLQADEFHCLPAQRPNIFQVGSLPASCYFLTDLMLFYANEVFSIIFIKWMNDSESLYVSITTGIFFLKPKDRYFFSTSVWLWEAIKYFKNVLSISGGKYVQYKWRWSFCSGGGRGVPSGKSQIPNICFLLAHQYFLESSVSFSPFTAISYELTFISTLCVSFD